MSHAPPDWYFTRDSRVQVQSLTDLKSWVKWQACIPEHNFSHFGLFFLSQVGLQKRRSLGAQCFADYPPAAGITSLSDNRCSIHATLSET